MWDHHIEMLKRKSVKKHLLPIQTHLMGINGFQTCDNKNTKHRNRDLKFKKQKFIIRKQKIRGKMLKLCQIPSNKIFNQHL